MQRIDAGALVLTDTELLLVARLIWLGLRAMERHDGGAPDGFRVVAAEVCAAAEQSRARIEREARRSRAGSGTTRARTGPAGAVSGRWLTTKQVAGMLGYSDESYVRRLARKGRLIARLTGAGTWEVEPNQIAAIVRERAGIDRFETAA